MCMHICAQERRRLVCGIEPARARPARPVRRRAERRPPRNWRAVLPSAVAPSTSTPQPLPLSYFPTSTAPAIHRPPTPLWCALSPLRAGDAVTDAGGRLVYSPAPDYFNCEAPPEQPEQAAGGRRWCGEGKGVDESTGGGIGEIIGEGLVEEIGGGLGGSRLPRADEFSFCVVDAHGQRSANVSQRVWGMVRSGSGLVLGYLQLWG